MKEQIIFQIYPTEMTVTPKGTTVKMVSGFPGNEIFREVARDLFSVGKMDDLSAVQVMDRHPGNYPHEPRITVCWEAKWNKGVNAPAYAGPRPSNN